MSNWFKDRRQEYIAATLQTVGQIRRSDLVREFGVSIPQASLDIAAFLSNDPPFVRYDVSAKTYVLEDGILDRPAPPPPAPSTPLVEDHHKQQPATAVDGAEGPQDRGLKTCKGCEHFVAKDWREPSGDGETWDSGTSTTCKKVGWHIQSYALPEPAPPKWCPFLTASGGAA